MRLVLKCLLFALLITLPACGSSEEQSGLPIDGSYKPADSLGDAVQALLAADQRGDYATSFALITPEARRSYKDVVSWAERRQELPAITGFRLGDRKDSLQIALVNHVPALDPFKGLSPAEERQNWMGRKVDGGWLLEADPVTEPVLPPESAAPPAVVAWAQAVQACDRVRARSFQAVETLFATGGSSLCNVAGPVVPGVVERLPEGPASSSLVSQYSADVFFWARVVPLQTPVPMKVIVAPLGNEWKVLGLFT